MASVNEEFTYDVFISFRGEDTRYGFTGHLRKALDDKGVRTFMDDVELQKGDEITPSLLKAIEDSKIAIIVLSKNYASSSFCLQELSKILDSMKDKGRSVLPVFYKVDPSDLRKLKRSYGEAMDKHDEASSSSHNMNIKWKMSLHQVANLSGFHYRKGDGYEHEFIGKIVEQVLRKIKSVTLPLNDYLVGLEPQKEHVMSLLNVGYNNSVHMVGIHGIGGIGKTTLALAVFNLIAHQFEGSCFLENVRENSEKHGLPYLQKILLSKVVGKKIELEGVRQGISMIQQRLRQKKFLLVLDDVNEPEQLQAIAGRHEWFGSASRVIITTRDKRLLTCHGVESTFEVKELNKNDAFELLRQKALKIDKVDSGYVDVFKRVITYASGLPLALEVIGSHLFNKTIEQCNFALDRYERRIPDKKIQMILQTSFDDLNEEEKSVFLDIACCFKGCKLAKVEKILHAHHGESKKDQINVLVEKSLIKISESDNVTLHDLIEDMGKEIVRQESPEEPGKRSRLWLAEDMVHVLEENTGTSKIAIIYLHSRIEVKWDGVAFKKMRNLRTLIIGDGHFSASPKHLPNSLRVLKWWKYPSLDLPYDFHPKKLAICKLASSNFTSYVWGDLFKKKFENLKVLNLNSSRFLTQIPDMSGLPNLEEFSFQCCENLITIDDSVGLLDKLKILSVSKCQKLTCFPTLNLASLEQLDVSYCDSLENFPPIVGGLLEKLKILRVINCNNIRSIPPLKLISLEELEFSYCDSLESFSPVVDELLGKLKIMRITYCRKLKSIPPLKLVSLEQLNLLHCDNLESFSPVVDEFLCKLKIMRIANCRKLKSIPPLKLVSLERFHLLHCDSLESFPPVVDGLLEKLKILRVISCRSISSIPPLMLTSLEKLDFSYCDNLESFSPVLDKVLVKLKFLTIKHCRKLKSIPPLKLASLEQLDISYCDSLENFPPLVYGLSNKLKIFRVVNCINIRSLPCLNLSLLEELEFSYCDNLESFPPVVDGMLDKLKILRVHNCSKLMSFPPLRLASLEQLSFLHCGSLRCFPLVVDGLLCKLTFLSVRYCGSLRSFPPLKLPSVEELNISHCYSLERFPPVVDGFLDHLKIMRVQHCCKLKSFPPLKLASLVELEITHCHSLKNFPPVVDGFLGELKFLNVSYCSKLRRFPPLKLVSLVQLDILHCDSLERFPPVVDGLLDELHVLNVKACIKLKTFPPLKLANLRELVISYCYSLESFPEILGEVKHITELHLDQTPIKELPFSFQNLTQIQSLYMCNCGIVKLPSCITMMSELDSLTIKGGGWQFPNQEMVEEKVSPMQSSQVEFLNLSNCILSNESLAIGLNWFSNVNELYLSWSKFTILPECIKECHFLWKLDVDNCEKLQEIKGIPQSLKVFSAFNCISLYPSCTSKFLKQELHKLGSTNFLLPQAEIPKWFDHQCLQRSSISFWFRNKLPAISLCAISPLAWDNSQPLAQVTINGIINTFSMGNHNDYKQPKRNHLHLCDMQLENSYADMDSKILKNKGQWHHAVVEFGFLKGGIHVLKEKSSMKDIQFTNPENYDVNREHTL